MEKRIYKKENYKTSKWSGGNTRELAIYPEQTEYLDRNFIWRLSSADSDLEESSFTKLPDYDRVLMVLEGDVVLAHGEERTVKLGAMEQDSFDGAVKTKCFGKLKKDYNLIMRKGCRGRMEALKVKSEAVTVKISTLRQEDGLNMGSECASYGIFCNDGYIVLSVNGQSEMINEDQLMIINCNAEDKISLSIMGEGTCIFAEVIYERENVGFEEIPAAKATGADFCAALRLFLGNNKWSKLVRRVKKKGDFRTPALEKKLAVLDKFYITGIVWIIGVILCLTTMIAGFPGQLVALFVVIYSIIDFFLISPLIYMAILPKPISAHIKKADSLTPFERKLYEEQLVSDPHHEKLMHKYRDRTGEEYDGMGDFIRKLNK